ncbi:trypsin-like peptidase domain-containing protein [Fimbriiglobus ruber]|nr:trypsin-like peptidase domain-containing protein [Fimbriiglobus ruber]
MRQLTSSAGPARRPARPRVRAAALRAAPIFFFAAALAGGYDSAARADDRPTGTSLRRDETVAVVERVKASVVNIHSERTVNPGADDPFRVTTMQPQRVNGMGTGIVLDPRGYIVTNYHVVDEVQSLRVRLVDGTNCPARVVATDKESDLAVIKIDPPRPLPTVPLGTATDLMLAERVIAIGNAYGYEHTVTVGHVSAMKRDVTLNKEISYKSLIQTQTPINPGNSGGPLFNRLGEVVGVNVAIRAGAQNIAFAIPVDTMIAKAADMLSVRRRLGVHHGLVVADKYERETEDAVLHRWVAIQRVEVGSPAAEAGLHAGDVIERVGDVQVATSLDLERALFDRSIKSIPVKIRRAGEAEATDVTLSLQPVGVTTSVTTTADTVWRRTGMRLLPVGADSVARVDRQLRGGLAVQDVSPGSAAARAGLQKGDVLIGLHLWESINLDNVLFVLNHKDLATFNPVKTYFVRDGRIQNALLVTAE